MFDHPLCAEWYILPLLTPVNPPEMSRNTDEHTSNNSNTKTFSLNEQLTSISCFFFLDRIPSIQSRSRLCFSLDDTEDNALLLDP